MAGSFTIGAPLSAAALGDSRIYLIMQSDNLRRRNTRQSLGKALYFYLYDCGLGGI